MCLLENTGKVDILKELPDMITDKSRHESANILRCNAFVKTMKSAIRS